MKVASRCVTNLKSPRSIAGFLMLNLVTILFVSSVNSQTTNSAIGICLYRVGNGPILEGLQVIYVTREYCYGNYDHPPSVSVVGWSPLRDVEGKSIQTVPENPNIEVTPQSKTAAAALQSVISNPHHDGVVSSYSNAIRDLRSGCAEARISV